MKPFLHALLAWVSTVMPIVYGMPANAPHAPVLGSTNLAATLNDSDDGEDASAAVSSPLGNGWMVFTDTVQGFSLLVPDSWYIYPSDGSPGRASTFSNRDLQSTAVETDTLVIEASLMVFDRDPVVPLRDWIRVPSVLAARAQVDGARPVVYSDQLIVESYETPEGSIRRAYVARGPRVYRLDLIPDSEQHDMLFAAVVSSFSFTDQVMREQPVANNAFGDHFELALPVLLNRTDSAPTTSTPDSRGDVSHAVPDTYRLPFTGAYSITQGPGCWQTHQVDDFEALDFAMASGVSIYAAEAGTLHRYADLPGYGNTIKIAHADGRVSWYSHLREFMAANGLITKGEVIGRSGGAARDPGRGTSTGAHLHFMIQAQNVRQTEWIRTLPGISWYSGDPAAPCNNGRFGHPIATGYADGEGYGPTSGNTPPPACQAPSLTAPAAASVFSTAAIEFQWGATPCAAKGYRFRIRTGADMEGGGAIVQDVVIGGTQRTESISSQWHNMDLYWSVKPEGVANATWAPARRLRVNISALPADCPAPQLLAPVDGVNSQNGSLTFTWNDISCTHSGFTFQIKTVPTMDTGGQIVISTANGTTQRTQSVDSRWHNQDLYWSVKASGNVNASWSPARRLRISPAVTLARPTLTNPTNGSVSPESTNVVLTWNATAGASQYKVELWGGSYGIMTVCDWQAGTSCHVGQLWPGTMSWRVQARNGTGQESDWSDSWSFTIESTATPAGQPVLSQPNNGVSLPQSTDVILTWSAASGATQYTVEVWGGPYSRMTACAWQAGTTCHLGAMWPGTMSWHVKARNAGGQESAWSDTWSFIVESSATTGQPTLSSPANGTSWASSTSIMLNWNSASGATQYKVELWGGAYGLMTPCDWQSGTSCTIGTMWPGTMSWHVRARNVSGQESDWSDTWTFTIQTATATPVPSVTKPTLSSPGNGTSWASSTSITLNWNSASGATQYKVELWGGPYSLMTPCDWQSGTSCTIGTMWPGTMSWHVRARNVSGQESDWSDTWTFTIQTATATPVPSVTKPTLSSPGNGTSWAPSTSITLNWNSASGATQYKVELWGGPYSLMTPCDWQSGTSCTIGTMWPGTMSWHVRARNVSGQESDWSDTWTFTIQTATATPVAPTATPSWRPLLQSPNNGSALARNTVVTLRWNSLSGATQYKVELWGGPYSLMTPCDWQSGTTCHIGTMWPGVMYWRVRARNGGGQESDWSETWTFTISN